MHGLQTHPQLCNCGPVRQRPHTALKRTPTTELRRLHLEVDVESVFLFLSSPQTDPILDVIACGPDDYERFLIDVTVRTPHARKCGKAAMIPGAAALNGEADKLRRFGEHVKMLLERNVWEKSARG